MALSKLKSLSIWRKMNFPSQINNTMKKTYILLFLTFFTILGFSQDPQEYDGDWQNDKRHGQGKMLYYDGSSYEGQWVNNLRQGQGTMVFSNKETYTGDWVNDKIQGNGVYVFRNSDNYEGPFVDGAPNGIGTFTLKNGDVYNGVVAQGEITGSGTMNFANKDEYVGAFVDGKMKGEGSMYYVSGDEYEGSWDNSKRDGYGVQDFVNGDWYEGGWKNDKMFGIGILNKANGEKYVGEFNKEYEGMGKLTKANGDYIEGDFKNGQADGEATIWYANNEQYQGEVKNGLPDGNGTYFYSDGTYYKGQLKKGVPDGMGTLYADNGESIKGGKWNKGDFKRSYEQIQAGAQALAEGVAALTQGISTAVQQSQAYDAQLKAQVDANNARWDNYLQQSREQQNQYNQLYEEEMKNTEDPFVARYRASQRMQGSSNQNTPSSGITTASVQPAVNTASTNYTTPSVYNNTSNNTSSGNYQQATPAQRQNNSQSYNSNSTFGETTLIETFWDDMKMKKKERFRAKLDEYGDVIHPFTSDTYLVDGEYQSWYEDGTKKEESYYVDGDMDGEYKYWNKDGTISNYSTNYTEHDTKPTIDIEWIWKDGVLSSFSLENLRAEDPDWDTDRTIFDISYFASSNRYGYSDYLRNLYVPSGTTGEVNYYDDEISVIIDVENGNIMSRWCQKGQISYAVQYYSNGNIKRIADYPTHNYYKDFLITYDESGKVTEELIVDQSAYEKAVNAKDRILEVYQLNYDEIMKTVNQYLPMTDPSRYK